MTQSRRMQFIKGVIVDFGSSFLIIAAGLIVTPIILSYLSDASYGFWMTIVQVIGVLGVIEMGTGVVITQRSASPSIATNHDAFSRLMTVCLVIQFIIAVVILISGLILAKPLFSWFKVDAGSISSVVPAYHLMLVWFSTSLMIGLFPALLAGRQKIAQAHAMNAAMSLISTAGVVPFLMLGAGVLAFPMAQWLAGLVGVIVAYVYLRKYIPPFDICLFAIRYKELKDIFNFSFFSWVGKIGYVILSNSDNIIIAAMLGPASVTLFLLSSRLNSLFAGNMAKLSSSSLAGFSELYATHNYERLQANALGLFSFAVRIACLGGVIVAFCTERFVGLWVGPQYFAGASFALLLGCLCFRDTIIKGSTVIIIASGDVRGLGLSVLSEGIVKIIFVMLFIIYFKLGIIAIILGQLLPTMLISGIYFPVKACRLTKLSSARLLKEGFAKVILKSVPSMVLVMLTPLVPASWGWGGLLLICGAALLVNILCFEGPEMVRVSELSWKDRFAWALRSNFL